MKAAKHNRKIYLTVTNAQIIYNKGFIRRATILLTKMQS